MPFRAVSSVQNEKRECFCSSRERGAMNQDGRASVLVQRDSAALFAAYRSCASESAASTPPTTSIRLQATAVQVPPQPGVSSFGGLEALSVACTRQNCWVARREDTLIAQIERDALDDGVPVATALRKCIVLGGKSDSEQLRDWATRELQGYHGQDDLPDYRVIAAPLVIDGIAGNYQVTRQPFPPSALPDFAREHISERLELRDGVGSLEALAQQAEIKLAPPMATDLARYMNAQDDNPYQHIISIYWIVSPSAVRGVLDQVRTALTQLVAELRANMSGGEDVPSAEAANQAVSVVVTGKRSQVNVTTAQASGPGTAATATAPDAQPEPEASGFWTRSRKIGAFIVGLASVVAAVIAVIEFL